MVGRPLTELFPNDLGIIVAEEPVQALGGPIVLHEDDLQTLRRGLYEKAPNDARYYVVGEAVISGANLTSLAPVQFYM